MRLNKFFQRLYPLLTFLTLTPAIIIVVVEFFKHPSEGTAVIGLLFIVMWSLLYSLIWSQTRLFRQFKSWLKRPWLVKRCPYCGHSKHLLCECDLEPRHMDTIK